MELFNKPSLTREFISHQSMIIMFAIEVNMADGGEQALDHQRPDSFLQEATCSFQQYSNQTGNRF